MQSQCKPGLSPRGKQTVVPHLKLNRHIQVKVVWEDPMPDMVINKILQYFFDLWVYWSVVWTEYLLACYFFPVRAGPVKKCHKRQ